MRLFVAIELDERPRSRLEEVQAGLRPHCDGVRWVRPELLHLTVKFLGEVADSRVPEVSEAVVQAAATVEPFTMTITGCGCFPPDGSVRIVWVGAEDASGTLDRCLESVDAELSRIGFPPERRPASPHITIGRVRADRSGGAVRSAVQAFHYREVHQAVNSVTLMSSVLSPKGPTYAAVGGMKFGPQESGPNQ